MGNIAAVLLWVVFTTLGASWLAGHYDAWIARAYDQNVKDATRKVLPTSVLVVIGVGATEIFRAIRWMPIVWMIAEELGMMGWEVVLAVTGALFLDSASAYAATGVPMMRGDWLREARARETAETVAQNRLERAARELQDADAE